MGNLPCHLWYGPYHIPSPIVGNYSGHTCLEQRDAQEVMGCPSPSPQMMGSLHEKQRGHSGRELGICTEMLSSRRSCPFLQPWCLEKCLTSRRWLINTVQLMNMWISKWLMPMSYISSVNGNTLLFWLLLHWTSLLWAQTNIPLSVRKRKDVSFQEMRNHYILELRLWLFPTSPNLFTHFHILVMVFPWVSVDPTEARKWNLERN